MSATPVGSARTLDELYIDLKNSYTDKEPTMRKSSLDMQTHTTEVGAYITEATSPNVLPPPAETLQANYRKYYAFYQTHLEQTNSAQVLKANLETGIRILQNAHEHPPDEVALARYGKELNGIVKAAIAASTPNLADLRTKYEAISVLTATMTTNFPKLGNTLCKYGQVMDWNCRIPMIIPWTSDTVPRTPFSGPTASEAPAALATSNTTLLPSSGTTDGPTSTDVEKGIKKSGTGEKLSTGGVTGSSTPTPVRPSTQGTGVTSPMTGKGQPPAQTTGVTSPATGKGQPPTQTTRPISTSTGRGQPMAPVQSQRI